MFLSVAVPCSADELSKHAYHIKAVNYWMAGLDISKKLIKIGHVCVYFGVEECPSQIKGTTSYAWKGKVVAVTETKRSEEMFKSMYVSWCEDEKLATKPLYLRAHLLGLIKLGNETAKDEVSKITGSRKFSKKDKNCKERDFTAAKVAIGKLSDTQVRKLVALSTNGGNGDDGDGSDDDCDGSIK